MITGHSNGQDLIMKANEKYLVKNSQQPERGKIYDRNGKVLAEDVERYKLVAVVDKKASKESKKPRHVVDKKKTAKKLAEIIDMDADEIEKRLNNKKAFQIEFGQKGTNLTYQEKEKIEKMKLPGIALYPETERFYPNGNFASHLIGMAQKDPDTGELNGALGVEKIFNSYLNGSRGALKYIHDIWGYIAPNTKKEQQPKRGDDVHGLAAAIQEGKFKPDEKYKSGHRNIMGSEISDWNKTGWGRIPMSLGFTYSSNTLMMHLQDLVGADKMKSWYERFGFGKKTGGMFDGEAAGNIGWANELQQKTSAFGQSTTVTPAQMIQAQSAFFNKGNMLKPWFVSSIDNPITKKNYYSGKKEFAGKPVTEETANKVEEELDKVVNSKKSHAMNYRVKGYDIEGKTGTAQVADSNGGGYVKGENPYFVSFIGDAPKKKPKVIVYAGMSLAQKNDQEAYEMGVSKAFKPIMENTLKYLNVGKSSDTSSKTDYSKVPNVQGDEVQKAEDSVNAQSLKPITIGNGKQIKQQSVKSGTKVLPHSKVMLMTDGELTMPDMTGWTKEDVLAFEDLTKIKVSTKGNGFVTNQSISKGQIIKNKDKIEVSLSAEDTDDDQEKTDEDSSDNKSKKDKADEDHSNTSSSTKNDKSNADSKNDSDDSTNETSGSERNN